MTVRMPVAGHKAMLLAAGVGPPFNIDVKFEKADVVSNFRTPA